MMFLSFLLVLSVLSFLSLVSSSPLTLRVALHIAPSTLSSLHSHLESLSTYPSANYGKYDTPNTLRSQVGLSVSDISTASEWIKQQFSPMELTIRTVTTGDYLLVDFPEASSSSSSSVVNEKLSSLLHVDFPHPLIDLITVERKEENSPFEVLSFKKSDSLSNTTPKPSASSNYFSSHRVNNKEFQAIKEGKMTYSELNGKNHPKHRHGLGAQKKSLASAPSPQDNTMGTPVNQRAAYHIPATLTGTNPKSSNMVWGTATYGYLPSDLQSYYAGVAVNANEINYVSSGNSMAGTPGGDNFGEATLDITVISGIATNIMTVVYNNDNSSDTEEGWGFGPAFLSFVSELNQQPTVPYILSISLGSLSYDSCNLLCTQLPIVSNGQFTYNQCQQYLQQQRQVCMFNSSTLDDRISYEFMKLSARGVTILAAAGDGGSHFSFQFFNSDAIGTLLNQISCAFASFPTFPAESPYVIAVGGTDWSQGGYQQPQGWVASGAGASWRFPMPSYQTATAQQYYKNAGSNLPALSTFNSTNRLYPDLACLATNVPMVEQGMWTEAGGTSASAPAAAAFFAYLVDLRLNNNLPSLGWVNPRLYAMAQQHYAEMFVDLTVGNTDCDSAGNCCSMGFPATEGFDVFTGFGQPLFDGFVKYFGTD